MTYMGHSYDVFLGGSCGETVWRSEDVIPHLEQGGISYYDPQRKYWSDFMIGEESKAKENSKLFLFVFDPILINATSFLEVAYLAVLARQAPVLIVVFLRPQEWEIDTKQIYDVRERNRTRDLVISILKHEQVPILHTIDEALNRIDNVILDRKTRTSIFTNPTIIAVKSLHFLRLLSTGLRMACTGKSLERKEFSHWSLHLIMALTMSLQLLLLSFLFSWLNNVPFLTLMLTFIGVNLFTSAFFTFFGTKFFKEKQARIRRLSNSRHLISYDVYLAGSCDCNLEWITNEAIPLLHENGLSYNSICDDIGNKFILMENCRQILYYIPSFSSFISGVVQIAYLLGHSNWNVSLCIPLEALQFLRSDQSANWLLLRRDYCYSMAFRYMKDLAFHRHSPLFDTLQEALEHVVIQEQLIHSH